MRKTIPPPATPRIQIPSAVQTEGAGEPRSPSLSVAACYRFIAVTIHLTAYVYVDIVRAISWDVIGPLDGSILAFGRLRCRFANG